MVGGMGFTFVRIFCLFLAVAGVPLSLLLLAVHESREGLFFGVAALLGSAAPLMGCLARERQSARWGRAGLVAVLGWAVLTAGLALRAPDGRLPVTARVQHRYSGGEGAWRFPRYALGNLLPELDQFLMGFRIVPAMDPLFTMKQATEVCRLTTGIYGELEGDADFHALGSVMPHAYDEIWGLEHDHGHSFLYIPARLDRAKPQPVLVFLHGSGGNFKAYTWLLAQVAEELGMVVIVPSYGLGNWRAGATEAVVKAALADAAGVVAIDPQRRHLMGLSNGALGVSHAGSTMGDQFASLIFLSPVIDRAATKSPVFLESWKDRPILMISGALDDRVPILYVTSMATILRDQGAQVKMTTVEGADHFMLFSHRQAVLREIAAWLRGVRGR